MNITLTGAEYKAIIMALVAVPANRSFNALAAIMRERGEVRLGDATLARLEDAASYTLPLEADDLQVIIEALSERPLREVYNLFTRLLNTQNTAQQITLDTEQKK